MKPVLSSFYLFLVFFPCYFFHKHRSKAQKWADFMVCNDHTDSFTFLLLTGFMQYYQTFHFISRLFFPLKKLFPDINEDFFTLVFLVFLWLPTWCKNR